MAKAFGVVDTKGSVDKKSACAYLGGILADSGRQALPMESGFQQTLSPRFLTKHKASGGLITLVMHSGAGNPVSSTTIRHKQYDESIGNISISNIWTTYVPAFENANSAYQPVHYINAKEHEHTPSFYVTFMSQALSPLPNFAYRYPSRSGTPYCISKVKEA
jgi:hypothetical protein